MGHPAGEDAAWCTPRTIRQAAATARATSLTTENMTAPGRGTPGTLGPGGWGVVNELHLVAVGRQIRARKSDGVPPVKVRNSRTRCGWSA
jgi:hypothetical protein